MELQKNILLFFSGIHNNFLDKLVELITLFGEYLIPLAVALFIYWCVDKKKGFIATFLLTIASCLTTLIKSIVRFPRPWTVIPELDAGRMQTATGYSFPSGHSTTASCFYSAIAFNFKKRAISIICAIIVLLVPISRLYLCVHWPLDVFCGTLLGFGTTFILFDTFVKIFENRHKYFKQMIILGALFAAAALIMSVLLQAELIDFLAFSDFSKNLAMFGGALIGFSIEEKNCDFSTDGTVSQKVVRYVVGMGVAFFLLEGVKLFTPYVPVVTFFRYFSVTFWAAFYPMVGKKLKLFH